ncbi:DUF3037 domain-containing protein [Kineosporia sp. A_224]|uniref:DUF3037 domain-containing protein n=1 Tax=Kineosporia sp. A_224 TaxID=1962180 RepID=UPI000B4BC3C7|nr:DUF3037 domain-containing protein [Kineosporia sp. A_224]
MSTRGGAADGRRFLAGEGPAAGERVPFEYAVLRAVPRVDRGECVNIGVVLYSQATDYLGCALHVDAARLRALDAGVDVDAVEAVLAGIRAVCHGDPAAGGAAAEPARVRFGWLTAPRSTVVQPGPVHSGLTADPAADLDRLLERLVR